MSLHLSSAPWSEQCCILSPGLLGTSLEPPVMQGIESRPRGPGVYVGGGALLCHPASGDPASPWGTGRRSWPPWTSFLQAALGWQRPSTAINSVSPGPQTASWQTL